MKYDITVLLDRSGSMQQGKDDFVGGLKSFINDQKNSDPTNFTLVQFDSNNPFELVFDGVDVNSVDVDKVELVPRGGTPLLDAIGKTIAHIEERVKEQKEIQPLLMIITDGCENQSHEWNKERVRNAIKEKQDSWKIMFLGADIDAYEEAEDLGIHANSTAKVSKTSRGINSAYSSMSAGITRMKSAYDAGLTRSVALNVVNYTDEEKEACLDLDNQIKKG